MVSVQSICTECLLKSARANAGTLYFLGFPIYSRRASEILALVELLSRTLLADNCLVTRYEPGKEPSVSVCHNSNFDWLIMEAGYRTYPAVLTTCHRTQYYEGSNESCYPSIRESSTLHISL